MLTSLDSLILSKIRSFLPSAIDAKNFRLSCKHVANRIDIRKIHFGYISQSPILFNKQHIVYRKLTLKNNIIPEKQISAYSHALDTEILKLIWTTNLNLKNTFRVYKNDLNSMRFLNLTSKLVQINVRWMMRDMSNLVDNYRSQIRYTTELWNKGRLIGTSTTSTMAISRKETWCYARLRPCKGVMSGFDFGDIETFDVIFKADEDNRYKGNLAWYFTELIISPYSSEQPELTCPPIPDSSLLPRIEGNSIAEKSLLSCAKNFIKKPQNSGFKLSSNYQWLNELYYENLVQKLAGYLLPVFLAVFTSLVFGSEFLDRVLTFENVCVIVGGLLVAIYLVKVI